MKALGRYSLLWFAAMVAIALTPFWREADWQVFGWLNKTNAPHWPAQWVIVDVPYEDSTDDPTLFREQIAAVLSELVDRERPRMVVLDVYFSSDSRGLTLLDAALLKLRAARIPAYAAITPLDHSGNVTAKFMDAHAASIYQTRLDGFGHTQFEFGGHTLKYDPYLSLSSSLAVPALAVVVAEQQFGRPIVAGSAPLIVNVGSPAIAANNTVRAARRSSGGIEFVSPLGIVDLLGKNVLIGSLSKDRSPYAGRSGPELLAWALIERTASTDAASSQRPLTSNWILLALVIVVPALSAVAFSRLRRLRLSGSGALWLPPLGAVVAGFVLIALSVALAYALGYVYPRVTLVAIGVMIATLLMSFHARQQALRSAVEMQVSDDHSAVAASYDVFISYSRTPENALWVSQNVYQPLHNFRGIDGRPLRVFFDTENIKTGASWYATLVEAINNSRYFIAIYSGDYFDKGFCRFEMERAAIKRVHQSNYIIPILREPVTVPSEYDHIQFVDARTNPDFMATILAQVQATTENSHAPSLSKQPPAAADD